MDERARQLSAIAARLLELPAVELTALNSGANAEVYHSWRRAGAVGAAAVAAKGADVYHCHTRHTRARAWWVACARAGVSAPRAVRL